MTESNLWVLVGLIILTALLLGAIYLSRRQTRTQSNNEKQTFDIQRQSIPVNDQSAPSSIATNSQDKAGAENNSSVAGNGVEIHSPAPRLQPELGAATSDPPQYRRRNYLFSYQERKFYEMLQENLDEHLQIFAKVRMADIVDLMNEPKDKGRYINWILTRHIDFVICDRYQQRPLVGIELDDSSHKRYDREESDKFKNSVFEQVGLPLLHFDVKAYTKAEVNKCIRQELHSSLIYREVQGSGSQG